MTAPTATAPRLLLAAGVPAPIQAALRERYDCVAPDAATGFAALTGQHGDGIDLFVTTATDGVTDDLMARLPGLRAVCSLGVGVDALDLAAARRRGVVVSNTPDVLNDCVADLAVGLLIDVARGMSRADRLVRRGDWPRTGPGPLGTRVSGRRLGLLGMGRIGQTIARRLAGFDMEIRYHTRTPVAQVPHAHEASLEALAGWCDFLVVACAGGEATRHLVNAPVLAALGPAGFLVNIARGSVVDEAALVDAFRAGALAGAALDVFASEPQVPPELLAMDNVVLLPHIASATAQTRRAMGDLLLANVASFVDSGSLRTPVA
ncbi:2-hydroxyacid dehydrogenase [Variovorax sp.]|uniref:2-hydroxyacid dehydrogenase n=1 Tax=Variovorax sp. TaxID=1871043 RepID=UPI002D57A79D|nr:2-hydroxyacid dehydrogenase [Variovorax sp.]HYP85515.1 2-hydroxyacid dehydrogenase [Variovorax sp.]